MIGLPIEIMTSIVQQQPGVDQDQARTFFTRVEIDNESDQFCFFSFEEIQKPITQEPLQSKNNFPKGLRGGGACFDWYVQEIVLLNFTQVFFVLVWLACAAAVPSRKSPASNVSKTVEFASDGNHSLQWVELLLSCIPI